MLLDADGDDYTFRDIYLRNGQKGGEEAADRLLSDVQEYMGRLKEEWGTVDVVVKGCANVSGLARALVQSRRISNVEQLREFISGFTRRQALFEIVDVGPGKERADQKIRGR